ncbi:phytanoyl-CoA hydroxylase-interacting protein-like [Ditylenchus destructor]|nr:phytanoyl-CoA hydroxylase-interacting protein-like [Ditylenchus destructor]
MSHSRYIGLNKYLLEGREQRPDNCFSDRIRHIVGNKMSKQLKHECSGIVFAADTKSGSIWNDGKLCVLPNVLINKEETNLYFGNFFCYTGYTHFVTLVVTRDGSEEDKYCSDKLVRIDMNDNLYFRAGKNEEVSFNMISGERIIVEIMYAHDIEFTAGDGRIWTMPATPDFQRWENDSSECE